MGISGQDKKSWNLVFPKARTEKQNEEEAQRPKTSGGRYLLQKRSLSGIWFQHGKDKQSYTDISRPSTSAGISVDGSEKSWGSPFSKSRRERATSEEPAFQAEKKSWRQGLLLKLRQASGEW